MFTESALMISDVSSVANAMSTMAVTIDAGDFLIAAHTIQTGGVRSQAAVYASCFENR